jgi:hypothetical protein
MSTLYEKDFCAWSQEQSKLLLNKRWDEIDIENIAEEIQDLGNSRRLSLESYLTVLFQHWIKKEYAQEMQGNSRSWDASIEISLSKIRRIINKNPALRREMNEMIQFAYQSGKRAAIGECTLIEVDMIPKECPWTVEEILDTKQGE